MRKGLQPNMGCVGSGTWCSLRWKRVEEEGGGGGDGV